MVKHSIAARLLLAVCCVLSGVWLAIALPHRIDAEAANVGALSSAPDCRPLEAAGNDCLQHLEATVISTEYVDGSPAGAAWTARAKLENGRVLNEVTGPITHNTKVGERFTAILYNGTYRYIDGYRPYDQHVGDSAWLCLLAGLLTVSLLFVVYGGVIGLYILLDVPSRFPKPQPGTHPAVAIRSVVGRGAMATGAFASAGILAAFVLNATQGYEPRAIAALSWLTAGSGIALEIRALNRARAHD